MQTLCLVKDVCTVLMQAHPLVIHSEVIIELDDAFSLPLELSVRLLSPPLFKVAMTVILAPYGHEPFHH